MDPTVNRQNFVDVVRLPVRVHAGNVAMTLRAAVTPTGRYLVIDLSETIAIDSTALGEIVRLHRRLLTLGGGVVLAAPTPTVRKVLSITRLDGLFALHPDVAAATTAIGMPS
jgi:anti-sigma B factor antagonist